MRLEDTNWKIAIHVYISGKENWWNMKQWFIQFDRRFDFHLMVSAIFQNQMRKTRVIENGVEHSILSQIGFWNISWNSVNRVLQLLLLLFIIILSIWKIDIINKNYSPPPPPPLPLPTETFLPQFSVQIIYVGWKFCLPLLKMFVGQFSMQVWFLIAH